MELRKNKEYTSSFKKQISQTWTYKPTVSNCCCISEHTLSLPTASTEKLCSNSPGVCAQKKNKAAAKSPQMGMTHTGAKRPAGGGGERSFLGPKIKVKKKEKSYCWCLGRGGRGIHKLNSPEKTPYKCPCCYNTPECHLNTQKGSNNSSLHNSSDAWHFSKG